MFVNIVATVGVCVTDCTTTHPGLSKKYKIVGTGRVGNQMYVHAFTSTTTSKQGLAPKFKQTLMCAPSGVDDN